MTGDNAVSQALDNLASIKNGEDPRSSDRDPLQVARDEVDRLWDEHALSLFLPRGRLSVGVARWKGKNGHCRYDKRLTKHRFNKRVTGYKDAHGSHTIIINQEIFDQGNVDDFIDTVRHEVAHVIAYIDPEAEGVRRSPVHRRGWQRWARRLGADPSPCHNKKETEYKYYYGCPNGHWKTGRHRKSKKIKHPELYRCKRCEESCVSWRTSRARPDDPGVSVL